MPYDDTQLLMLAIGDDTSGTLGSVNVGGGGMKGTISSQR
jgi:hypothetical protein